MSSIKKCIAWDLDNTIWDGICLEGKVKLRPGIRKVIADLDQRGIVHTIASRNDESAAMQVLQKEHLNHLFVVPQINWLPKTTNLITITKLLNISLDAMAFVDDDPFELEQVRFMLPDVMTINSKDAIQILHMPEFNPGLITRESKSRRRFYQAEQRRKEAESNFTSREEFLTSCNMKLSTRKMRAVDIPRVTELMTRTHQLNTTGQIFDNEKLFQITKNNTGEQVIVAELRDKFGWNGIVGTALISCDSTNFNIIFFAMSCRILGRGIERAFLSDLVERAFSKGCGKIHALYRNTGRNSMMRALYQMSGFVHEKTISDQTMIFKITGKNVPEKPRWVAVS